jgi:type I restriction enzyme R subunit
MPASSDNNYPGAAAVPRPVLREDALEYGFVGKLQELKYEYRRDITDRASLEKNFREKFEALNRVRLTDPEFARLLDEIVSPDVFTAAKTLREINAFTRDDGTPLNYTLVNIRDWCKNTFEVVNQLRINTDNSHHRYDVLLLINGVPCVQIELKTLGISPRRAMEQIVDYKNDPGNGYTRTLLCFLQLFIVSNRDRTYYFANNSARHFAFNADERFLPVYEFADEANRKIVHLDDFAARFLEKCALAKTISRYMVLIASEQKLMIMRPYQVYAVQQIVKCIEDDAGNGYIWHTTGSGKTLTSFKASTLLKDNPDIEKCLFVVDRKDLDRQTREEFNRFQQGCVEENTNTAALVRRLLSDDYADKVIVTTIQKLGLALDETSKRNRQRTKSGQPTYKEQLQALQDKRIVFIFDECHRSQFGENHKAIKAFFPKAQLFGFTGTPSFRRMPPRRRSRTLRLLCGPRKTSSRSSFTPTPSPTPSRTETSCDSMWTTSSRRRNRERSRPKPAKASRSGPWSRLSSRSTCGAASRTWPEPKVMNCCARFRWASNSSRRSPSRAPSRGCFPKSIFILPSWARPTLTRTPSFAPSSRKLPRDWRSSLPESTH